MKKIVCFLLTLLLVCALWIPAMAAQLEVIFTTDSKAEPGCRLTVNKGAMLELGSHTAETYNAMLEGNVVYRWYKNGTLNTEGIGENSYAITQADLDCTLSVELSFYEDADCSQLVGTAVSQVFTVKSGAASPEVTVPETTAPTEPAATEATTPAPTGATKPAETETTEPDVIEEPDLPYWVPILIACVAIAAGIGVAHMLVRKKTNA